MAALGLPRVVYAVVKARQAARPVALADDNGRQAARFSITGVRSGVIERRGASARARRESRARGGGSGPDPLPPAEIFVTGG